MTIPDDILDLDWVKINIYIHLKCRCNRDGEVSFSMRELSNEFNITRPTASRYVSELANLGVLFINGHQTDTKRTIISFKHNKLGVVNGHQTDTKRTIEERKKDFVERLRPYIETYGKDMLNDFYRYWAQVNDNGKKMLWEKQKCFEISLRLATWKKNETERSKQQTRAEDIGVVLAPTKDKFKNEEVW